VYEWGGANREREGERDRDRERERDILSIPRERVHKDQECLPAVSRILV
jgi:hypothetical protein